MPIFVVGSSLPIFFFPLGRDWSLFSRAIIPRPENFFHRMHAFSRRSLPVTFFGRFPAQSPNDTVKTGNSRPGLRLFVCIQSVLSMYSVCIGLPIPRRARFTFGSAPRAGGATGYRAAFQISTPSAIPWARRFRVSSERSEALSPSSISTLAMVE